MGDYIDRDPDQMISFGSKASQSLDNLIFFAQQGTELLEAYRKDLDDTSQAKVAALKESCETFYSSAKPLKDIAEEIQKKGEAIKRIRSEQ